MSETITARFEVTGWDPADLPGIDGDWVGAVTMRKTYTAGLVGESVAHFISSGDESGRRLPGRGAGHRDARRRQVAGRSRCTTARCSIRMTTRRSATSCRARGRAISRTSPDRAHRARRGRAVLRVHARLSASRASSRARDVPQVRLRQLDGLADAAVHHDLRHREREALDLRAGDRRRQRERERIGHQVDERRPVVRERRAERVLDLASGFSTRSREDAERRRRPRRSRPSARRRRSRGSRRRASRPSPCPSVELLNTTIFTGSL